MIETENDSEQDQFLTNLKEHADELISCDALKKLRGKSWDHFLKFGLPSYNTQTYRSIKLTQLFSQKLSSAKHAKISRSEISSSILPNCKHSVLVFVNGHYDKELSDISALPKKVIVQPLQEAIHTYGAYLNNNWSESLKEERDPFALLNGALHGNGCFIYVSPNTEVNMLIQILHVTATESPQFLMPRLQIFVGSCSQISFIDSPKIISGEGCPSNSVIDFMIEESAHVKLMQQGTQNEKNWKLDAVRVHLKKNATFKSVNITFGSPTLRYDYHVKLAGENCEAELNGLWRLKEKSEAHTNILIDHQAPHCRSMQLFKGVLNDFSRSTFEGKILVRQKADKTEAFQLNNNLLIGDRAMAFSMPNLEIFADDVKASHGATIGQLNSDQLFYLKTRGLEQSQAEELLVTGFCQEVLEKAFS